MVSYLLVARQHLCLAQTHPEIFAFVSNVVGTLSSVFCCFLYVLCFPPLAVWVRVHGAVFSSISCYA